MLSVLYVLLSFGVHIGFGSERVVETSRNTTDGFKFKIKRSLFTKVANKRLKINQNVNIIQQSHQPTPTNCGKACQDLIPCLAFVFHRKKQPLTCLLVDHSVNVMDLEDDDSADYYEIEVLKMLHILSSYCIYY